MPRNVDERVVELNFDNTQFERETKKSMETLSALKSSLDFSSLKTGLENVQKAIGATTFNPIASGLGLINTGFNSMEQVAIRVLGTVSEKILEVSGQFGQMFNQLTVQQVGAGFDKYSEKTKAVQTIMAATRKEYANEEEQMAAVTEQMSKLNWFTDETSYGFLDMVSNIGKFTANNIKLEDAVTAMEGISTWAAISGAGPAEAGRAMYNLAQALASGVVRLQDWKSIENANMATAEFKEMALKYAAQLGTVEDRGNGQYLTGVSAKGVERFASVENFTSSMTEDRWFTTEVLMKTLAEYGDFTNALYDAMEKVDVDTTSEMLDMVDQFIAGTLNMNAAAEETGLTAEELQGILTELGSDTYDLGRRSFRAAQEALTFEQALDSVKDAASTAWMNIFEHIFGDYVSSKKIWTNVANELWDVLVGPVAQLEEYFAKWEEFGGRNKLLAGIANLWSNALDIFDAISETFTEIFGKFTEDNLLQLTNNFFRWTHSILFSEEALENLKTVLRGVFSVFDILGIAFDGFKAVFGEDIGNAFGIIVDFGSQAAITIGNFINRFREFASESGLFVDIFTNAKVKMSEWYTTGRSYIDGFLQKVSEFLEIDIHIPTFEEIKNFFLGLKDSIDNFSFEDFKFPTLDGIISNLKTFGENVKRYLFGYDIDNGQEDGFTGEPIMHKIGMLEKIGTALGNAALGLLRKIPGWSYVEAFIEKAREAFEKFRPLGESWIRTAIEKVQEYWPKIKDFLFGYDIDAGKEDGFTGEALEHRAGLIEKIFDTISKIKLPSFDEIKKFGKNAFRVIKDFLFGYDIDAGKEDGFTGEALEHRMGFIEKVQNFYQNLKPYLPTFDDIKNAFIWIKDRVVDIFNATSPFLPTWEQIIGAIRWIVSGIASLFASQEGGNPAEKTAFLDGLLVVLRNVFSFIGGVAQALIEGFSKFTGLNSIEDYINIALLLFKGKMLLNLSNALSSFAENGISLFAFSKIKSNNDNHSISKLIQRIGITVILIAGALLILSHLNTQALFENAMVLVAAVGVFALILLAFRGLSSLIEIFRQKKKLPAKDKDYNDIVKLLLNVGRIMIGIGAAMIMLGIAASIFSSGGNFDGIGMMLVTLLGVLGGLTALTVIFKKLDLNAKYLQGVGALLKKFAVSLLIVAGAVAILNNFGSWDSVGQTLLLAAGMLLGIGMFVQVTNAISPKLSSLVVLNKMLKTFSGVILTMAISVAILKNFGDDGAVGQLIAILIGFVAGVGVFIGMVATINPNAKELNKLNGVIKAFGITAVLLSAAAAILHNFASWDEVGQIFVLLGVAMTALAGFLYFIKKNKLDPKISLSLIGLLGAMLAITAGFGQFTSLGSMLQTVVAIGAIFFEITRLVEEMKDMKLNKQMVDNVNSMLGSFSGFLFALSASLGIASKFGSWNGFLLLMASMTVVLGEIALFTWMLNKMKIAPVSIKYISKAAVAITLFSVGVGAALGMISKSEWSSLLASAVSMGLVAVALGYALKIMGLTSFNWVNAVAIAGSVLAIGGALSMFKKDVDPVGIVTAALAIGVISVALGLLVNAVTSATMVPGSFMSIIGVLGMVAVVAVAVGGALYFVIQAIADLVSVCRGDADAVEVAAARAVTKGDLMADAAQRGAHRYISSFDPAHALTRGQEFVDGMSEGIESETNRQIPIMDEYGNMIGLEYGSGINDGTTRSVDPYGTTKSIFGDPALDQMLEQFGLSSGDIYGTSVEGGIGGMNVDSLLTSMFGGEGTMGLLDGLGLEGGEGYGFGLEGGIGGLLGNGGVDDLLSGILGSDNLSTLVDEKGGVLGLLFGRNFISDMEGGEGLGGIVSSLGGALNIDLSEEGISNAISTLGGGIGSGILTSLTGGEGLGGLASGISSSLGIDLTKEGILDLASGIGSSIGGSIVGGMFGPITDGVKEVIDYIGTEMQSATDKSSVNMLGLPDITDKDTLDAYLAEHSDLLSMDTHHKALFERFRIAARYYGNDAAAEWSDEMILAFAQRAAELVHSDTMYEAAAEAMANDPSAPGGELHISPFSIEAGAEIDGVSAEELAEQLYAPVNEVFDKLSEKIQNGRMATANPLLSAFKVGDISEDELIALWGLYDFQYTGQIALSDTVKNMLKLLNSSPEYSQLMTDEGANLIEYLTNGLYDEEAVNGLINAAQGIGDDIIAIFQLEEPEANQTGADYATEISKGIESQSDAVNDAAASVMGRSSSTVGSYKSRMYVNSQFAAQGIVEGFQSKVSSVIGAVSGVCSSIASTFKGFFGIASPSKLTTEWGEYLDQGLANGVLGKIGAISYAVGRMSDSVVDAFGNPLTDVSNRIDGGFDDAKLTPVFDMSDVQNGMRDMDSMLLANNARLGAAMRSPYNTMNISADSGIINEIRSIREEMASLHQAVDSLNNMQVLMDSKALVGTLSRPLDNALGRRVVHAARRN